MNACPPDTSLEQLLAEQLSGEELAGLSAHIDQCGSCQTRLEEELRLRETELPRHLRRTASDTDAPLTSDDSGLPRPNVIAPAAPSAGASTCTEHRVSDTAFLDKLVQSGLPSPSAPRIGPPGYQIKGELGRGGMGVVYLAEQVSLRRLVALKYLSAGAPADRDYLARFRAEAEAIARLRHPNIIQIHEVGEYDGLSYLTLEYLEGGSLDQKLAAQALSAAEAARLLETLARAAHYAHGQGIVHRDLKPANVLFSAEGAAKLTDFGLAKSLNPVARDGVSDDAGLTATGIIAGTPSYMAPEQALGGGEAITPATDVYQLGAVLYEMLTGRPPFKGSSVLETLEQVRLVEPVAPRWLAPRVPRDLETICLECLQKEPHRRYASALDLADDLHRFQEGQPIRARPISRLERAGKWARRRPALAGLSAAVTLLALTVVVVSVIFALHSREAVANITAEQANTEAQRRQAVGARTDAEKRAEEANEARREAEAISGFFRRLLSQADIGEQELSPGQMERNSKITVRELLDRAEKQIAGKFKDHPLTEAAVRQTLGETYRGLGLYAQAQPHAERAVALRSDLLGPTHFDTLSSKSNLAALYQDQGQYPLAEPLYRDVLAACTAQLAPGDILLLAAKGNLAALCMNQGQLHHAEALFQELLPEFTARLGADSHRALICKSNLAVVYRSQEKYSQAEPLLREVVAASTARLGADHPIALLAKDDLAVVYSRQQKYSQAEPLFEEVLAANIAKRGADHPLTLNTKNNLAKLYLEQQRYDRTEPLFREVLAARAAQLGADHPDTLVSKNNLAFLLQRQKKYAEAEPLYREVVAELTTKLGPDHLNTLHARNNQGMLYLEQRKDQLAEPLLATTFSDARAKLGLGHPITQRLARQLGGLYERMQTPEKADALLRELVEFQKQQSGLDAVTYAGDLGALGSILLAQRKWSEAEAVLRDCLAIRAQQLPDDWTTFSAKAMLGAALLGQERFADAEPLLLQGYEGMKERAARTPPPGKPRLAKALERLVQLYDAWGKPEKATQWRKELAAAKAGMH